MATFRECLLFAGHWHHHGWGREIEENRKLHELNGVVQNGQRFPVVDDDTSLAAHQPCAHTLVMSLKTFADIRDSVAGVKVHAQIVNMGLLERNVIVGNALVNMYAKCGLLERSQEICNTLPLRNVVSWNALISGYVEHEYGDEALHCYKQMQLEGLHPDSATYISTLKACAIMNDREAGKNIHNEIHKLGLLEKDIVVANALVYMYAKCGLLANAQEVFDMIPVRDAVLWGTLIAGFAQHGHGEQAWRCLEWMRSEGLCPDAYTSASIFKACGATRTAIKGQELHIEIVRQGYLETDIAVGNALINMYANCGFIGKAQEVFDELPAWDVVSWNTLISGYAQHGFVEQALECFDQMQAKGFLPDMVTFTSILSVCGIMAEVDEGYQIHTLVVASGFVEDDMLHTAVLDFYVKCGLLSEAESLHNTLSCHDVALWNLMIDGYTEHGFNEHALNCFGLMRMEGMRPNACTFAQILKACGNLGACDRGREVHVEIVKEGFLENDIAIADALVSMYAKSGFLTKARELFDTGQAHDVVSWSVLIARYAEHGYGEEALDLFEMMQVEGFIPDVVTFSFILKACALVGAAERGQVFYTKIVEKGLLEDDIVVGTALLDMFAKCGMLALAQDVFNALPVHDDVSWNALITAYALLGNIDGVYYSMKEMISKGAGPDAVTFTALLNSCSHTGLLAEGQLCFESMDVQYGTFPIMEHQTCIVDLFCRSGQLNKATRIINDMPLLPNLLIWHTILAASKKWGEIKIGRQAFEHVMLLDKTDSAAYVSFCNIFAEFTGAEENPMLCE